MSLDFLYNKNAPRGCTLARLEYVACSNRARREDFVSEIRSCLYSDIRAFMIEAKELNNPRDKDNADAVFQVSVSANSELFEKISMESVLCEALRELMKD